MPSNPSQVHVTRYENAAEIGWKMAIQPADKSWCLFIDTNDKPHFYVDEPSAVPVDERDEAKGFFPHAYRCAYPEGAHAVDESA